MAKKGQKSLAHTYVVTQETIDRVYQLTANGLSRPEVAGCLGVNETTFDQLLRKYPELRKASADGKYFGLQHVVGQLMSLVNEGNPAAIMFYLKTRWRWQERHKDEPNGGNLPADKKQDKIVFTAMSPTEAARVYQQVMRDS